MWLKVSVFTAKTYKTMAALLRDIKKTEIYLQLPDKVHLAISDQ